MADMAAVAAMVTPDQIRDRIKNLKQEQERLRDQIHAFSGAIQDCEYWLSQLEPEPPGKK